MRRVFRVAIPIVRQEPLQIVNKETISARSKIKVHRAEKKLRYSWKKSRDKKVQEKGHLGETSIRRFPYLWWMADGIRYEGPDVNWLCRGSAQFLYIFHTIAKCPHRLRPYLKKLRYTLRSVFRLEELLVATKKKNTSRSYAYWARHSWPFLPLAGRRKHQ